MSSHTYGNYKKKLNLENSLKIFLDRLLFLNSQTSIYFGTFILRERQEKYVNEVYLTWYIRDIYPNT